MHGQSPYTASKQTQLHDLLSACSVVWGKRNLTWAHHVRLFVDCMAGSGHTDDGQPGSPLILQNLALDLPSGLCVWCDVDAGFTDRLAGLRQGDTHVLTGRYQVEVRRWLERYSLSTNGPLMGLVYLDDNGCKEVWNDDGFLGWLMETHQYLDVAIHFSETAWRRNDGAGVDWAVQQDVFDMLRFILKYKPASVIYAPKNRQRWRMVYGVKSHKMNLTGYRRIKLRDYIERNEVEQQSLFA